MSTQKTEGFQWKHLLNATGIESYRENRRQDRTRLASLVQAGRQFAAPTSYALENRMRRNQEQSVSRRHKFMTIYMDAISNTLFLLPFVPAIVQKTELPHQTALSGIIMLGLLKIAYNAIQVTGENNLYEEFQRTSR